MKPDDITKATAVRPPVNSVSLTVLATVSVTVAASLAISVSGAAARTCGAFWATWCATNGLPTKVVRQPIPSVPPQSDPDCPALPPPAGRLRIGDIVTCDQSAGVFKPCQCGSTRFTVKEGRGPHAAQLACAACHKGGRWLSARHMEAVL
jgi:hypothetical protein